FNEEVRRETSLPDKVALHDATLRDGEQTPGVVFRKEEKIAIARMLDAVGVDRIEAGMPAVSQEDAEAITEISSLGLKSKVMVFSRAMPEDIDRAVQCGVWGIVIEVPGGLPRLKYQFKWSEDEIIERSVRAVSYAKDKGLFVNFFPYDTTRADLPFLKRLVGEVVGRAGPDSVSVVDTTGCILPRAMRFLVGELRREIDIPIEVHTHNDLGLGIANALAAVEAGAQVVHVCINGLGERCGNAALEEMAVSLKALMGLDLPIKFEKLSELSRMVEELSGVRLAANKPLVGDISFTRESGLGIDVLLREPRVGFSIHPEFVGRKFRVVLGKKSGKPSIELKVKRRSIEKKAWLEEGEFREIVKDVLGR
ncbi:MAG: 3-hydroxy-3-methylglutaryl-CoA lyase, partial [Nitrospinota bacterium]